MRDQWAGPPALEDVEGVQDEHVVVDLYPVIVGIGDYDIFLQSQTETVRGIELAFAGSQLAELAPDLHRAHLVSTVGHRVGVC